MPLVDVAHRPHVLGHCTEKSTLAAAPIITFAKSTSAFIRHGATGKRQSRRSARQDGLLDSCLRRRATLERRCDRYGVIRGKRRCLRGARPAKAPDEIFPHSREHSWPAAGFTRWSYETPRQGSGMRWASRLRRLDHATSEPGDSAHTHTCSPSPRDSATRSLRFRESHKALP